MYDPSEPSIIYSTYIPWISNTRLAEVPPPGEGAREDQGVPPGETLFDSTQA